MRSALTVLLCLLAAVAVFTFWGEDPAPGVPSQKDARPDSGVELAAVSDDGGVVPDTGRVAQPGAVVDPFAIPPGADVVRGRLLQNGAPLAIADIAVADELVGRSAADGTFVIVAPADRAHLQVRGNGVPRGVRFGPIEMHGMRDRDLGDLHVPQCVSVIGQVVDEQGHARTNMRVYATHDRFVDGVAHDDPKADLNALSRADGSFRIDGLRPGEIRVRVRGDGFGSQTRHATVRDGVGDVGMVVLLKREDLVGTIVDEQDRPIAGARVTPGEGRHRLQESATVTTDERGRFVFKGFGSIWSVRIEADGYARRQVDSSRRWPRPLRFQLSRPEPLHGHVAGLDGAEAKVFVDTPDAAYRPLPSWIKDYAWKGWPVAEDGSFSLPHLPKGEWVIRVDAPGVGTVPKTPFEMPVRGKLELQLTPVQRIEVTVVDDDGQAVEGAELLWFDGDFKAANFARPFALAAQMLRHRGRARPVTDADGKVTITPPANTDVKLAVRAPGFMPTATGFLRDKMPTEVTVSLQRAGHVVGRLHDAELTSRVKIQLSLSPLQKDGRPGVRRLLDASGSFDSGPLLPGDYTVGVMVNDMTCFAGENVVLSEPVPLIHDYSYRDVGTTVTVVGGETADVRVPMPAIGELRGRVLVGSRPIAGAIVYLQDIVPKGRPGWRRSRDNTGIDAYQFAPNCRTDEFGRYRILVAANKTVRIRARRDTSGWSPPVQLDVTPQSDVDLPDIILPSSAIRGRLDLTTLAPKQRRLASAQLYPIAVAAQDPFYFGDWSWALEHDVQNMDIGVTGEFAFEGVAAGTWVLRLRTGLDKFSVMRELTIVPDQVVDLGQLQPSPTVVPKLRAELPGTHGAWLRRVSPNNKDGIFVATLPALEGSSSLPKLPAGSYLLQPFERGPHYAGSMGTTGNPDGKPVEFVLHADGTTTPAVLWPNGF